jgi:hydroxyacylglutathione hydrolase
MEAHITTINLWRDNFMFKASGGVNAYLIETGEGFVLIDTGFKAKRQQFFQELAAGGCTPGNLKLVVLTHADMDHAGNVAAVKSKFGPKIAVHSEEAEAVRQGNMWLSRTRQPAGIARLVFSLFGPLIGSARCEPDLIVSDGQDLNDFGFDARVIELPGHSRGSIGVLTAEGDLFCGDLLTNIDRPARQSLVDDPQALKSSEEKLRALTIRKIYPGHGGPFSLDQLV